MESDGRNDVAGIKMKLFVEDKAGRVTRKAKYMRELDKLASKKL